MAKALRQSAALRYSGSVSVQTPLRDIGPDLLPDVPETGRLCWGVPSAHVHIR